MPRPNHYVDLAIQVARRDLPFDKRAHALGVVAIRRDGAIVCARNGSSFEPKPGAHAECRVLQKAGYGATLYVVRVKRDGTLGLAKPCSRCQALLRNLGAEVWYSNQEGQMERLR